MLDRPLLKTVEGKEVQGCPEEESDEDGELPSYLREESSDEEDAALYSKNKKNAQGDNSNVKNCILASQLKFSHSTYLVMSYFRQLISFPLLL
jgi:hypothetical protein